MAILDHDMVAKLIALAKETTIYDEGGDYAQVDDYIGGENLDGAYELGEEDGKTELAREILDSMGIEWHD